MGRTLEQATIDEFYRALCYTLREEIMVHWFASAQTQHQKDCRTLYYLSMEYLPGRLLSNNLTNINSLELVKQVLHKTNRNLAEIIGRESDLGLGNGGLGRLASCYLDSLATHHYPARGYGLRYQYGIFEQQIWDGMQIEAPDCWLMRENPWELRRDLHKRSVHFCGLVTPDTNIHGDQIHHVRDYEEVWAVPHDLPIIGYSDNDKYSVTTLRLWTTKESPRNFQLQRFNAGRLDQAAENSTLTDVLYPADHHETGRRIRLKQEFLLVSASVQDIIRLYLENHENFRAFADRVRIQINDTHPSLVVAELIRLLTQRYDLPWTTAVEMTQTVCGYTNHTIMSEALEEWDQNLFNYLLPRQARVIERLNHDFLTSVRARYPNDEEKIRRLSILEGGKVRMANLAILGSHRVNGVAELHTQILKDRVFKDFHELYPNKFINVTNGVTQRRWLLHCNPKLAHYITSRIGDSWITKFSDIAKLADFADDPVSLNELLAIKRVMKQRFIQFLKARNRLRDHEGHELEDIPLVNADSIFDVHIKRIHEYKRQLMNALHILMLYHEIKDNPEHTRVPRTFIFAGKAAPGYEAAKSIIRLIYCIARKINNDPDIKDAIKVVFVTNYSVSRAEIIIPATDLSEQISTAGMEASGTGNMKMAINGALTIGTEDGANIEMKASIGEKWWPFSFGSSADELQKLREDQTYSSWDICTSNPSIQRAVDSLRDGSLARTDREHEALYGLYNALLQGHYGKSPDSFYVLKDLQDYYATQRRVDELYAEPETWARHLIHNIAGMGPFSSDNSIKTYADHIWGLEPCPPDDEILSRIRHEYTLNDRPYTLTMA